MSEITVQIRIPTSLFEFGLNQDHIQTHVTEWLVLSLFTEGHVSSGKAAKLLNMTRIQFLVFLRQKGIAYLDYSPEELAEEFETIQNLELGDSL